MACVCVDILCLAALWASCSWGAEPEGNPRRPSCVQWVARACRECFADGSARAAARVQGSRAATLRRLLECAAAGRDDPDAELTVGRPDDVREATGGCGRSVTCYLADSIVPCWREDEALRQLCSAEFGRGQAVVEIGPGQSLRAGPAEHGSRARVVAETPQEIVVRCSVGSETLLVLRGTFLTAMECAVDSVSRSTLRVNYVSYGVVVPPGEREVRFLARSPRPWLPVAAGATALGLGMVGWLIWRKRRSRR